MDDFLVETAHADIPNGVFSLLADGFLQVFLGLCDHVFDPGRMDPAVGHELGQGQPRDLAANRVEARDAYGLRGVVDDEIDAGSLFYCSDVPSFSGR